MIAEDALGILPDLIAFRSVSRDSNLPCVDYVRSRLTLAGIPSVTLADATGTKANLVATIGPPVGGGVVLSAHMDVVPTDGQAWSTDPWRMTTRDGRHYGRGSCDMLGFLSLALATACSVDASRMARPVHLAFSYDEEVGCLGARALAAYVADQLPSPSAVLVGEPTGMKVVSGHKGITTFTTEVIGHSVHSSRVLSGVSAVSSAARLIVWLEDRMLELSRQKSAPSFDPPYTTIHCGMVQGGVAPNVVAPSCTFVTDIREVPDDSAAEHRRALESYIRDVALPRMRAISPQTDIVIRPRSETPSFQVPAGSEAESLARRLTGDNETRTVSFATEAGIYQAAGLATIICGPGDIAQAHQADEYIEHSQIREGAAFMDRLLHELSH